ncbi:hypothetical protein [Chryseobacterium sp. FH2]|uniref:hypothetical protein n=1 Tax=Chryseobacterium sp. FH2 TaxID=1674291 RepID=UPI000A6260BC|nr:hypothetical protein [Chryseobacterium sp. FH2]
MTENENVAAQPAENTPTQTLFRFVSLRTPQLSDDKDQDKKFVLMPQEVKTNGHFYTSVTTGAGSKKSLLLTEAASYATSLECIAKENTSNNLDTFKRNYKVVYDFAVWLARNKDTCTYQELISQRDSVFAGHYTLPSMTLLWDNFVYQVISQKDFYIKEVMMQMILALHVLQTITNSEEEIKILLNARIVLPKEMMMDDEALPVSQAVSKIASEEPKLTFPTEEMQKQQKISSAKTTLDRFEKLKKNLSILEKKYNKDYQSAYSLQKEIYDNEVAPIISEYKQAVIEAKEKFCGIRPPGQTYDPKDPCMQPREVPYPDLPKFNFSFKDQVSGQALVSSLKPDNLETVLDLLGFDFYERFDITNPSPEDIREIDYLLQGRNTFAEISELINESTEKHNKTIVENTSGNEEMYVSIGGVIIPTARATTEAFTYQLCPRVPYRLAIFDLALNVPDASWDVSYAAYVINSNTGAGSLGMDYYTKSRIGNTVFLNNLFKDGVDLSLAVNANIDFKITFTNGKVVTFTAYNINYKSCVSSAFEVEVEGEEPPAVIDEDIFIPSGFGFKQIGIADYLKVEQSTHAYVEGEVAHIENIMAREYREKSTRKLRKSENATTLSSDTEREQLSDTTTANRFEMQTEIAKMMQEASDTSVSTNFGASWGNQKGSGLYNIGLGANYASHKSKEESTRQAMTQSQDITARAMDRIVNKVHEERIEKIIEEFEENNSHGLDNRKGDKHVVGVYRWVDKLMKNQIYNYGKRIMFEFMIPEPAKLHLLGMINTKSADQTELIKPIDPRADGSMQIKNYSDLDFEVKLKYWLSKYNVEIEKKPLQSFSLGKSLSGQTSGNISEIEFYTMKDEIQIPEGYIATHGLASYSAASDGDGANVNLLLGDLHYHYWGLHGQADVGQRKPFEKPYSTVIPVSSTGYNQFCGTSNFVVDVELTAEAKIAWQQKAFKAIIDAYEEALVEYNKAVTEENDKAVVIKDSNPNFYRQIEQTVLRKNCISYMADRTVDSTHGYGLEGLTSGTSFGDYETVLSSKLDKHTAFVKFMEQAFEWENLSYFLYPFYWGKKSNWTNLYQAENTDPLFRSFLQSGMARVVATVRPGFEDAVQFYLATGKIWNGGEVPVIGDELYLSLVDEMKEPKGIKQGKAWLTRLPTTLNILQAESIGLKVAHALPFTTEDPDDFEVPSEVITEDKFNFENNDNLLGVQPSASSDKIISGDWV